MAELVKLAHNAVTAKLFTDNKQVRTAVHELLSFYVEGLEFMNAGSWNGRSSFYSMAKNTFPAGFVHMVHAELVRMGHQVHLVRQPLPEPLGPENPIVDEHGNDNPNYDYQMFALKQVEKHGRGIIRVATGGGKSKIANLIVSRYRRMTLFLTTRGVLMHQMRDQFVDIGLNCGILGDGNWKPVCGVNVGMVQTFVANLKEPNLDKEIMAVIKSAARRKDKIPTRMQALKIAQPKYDEKVKVREQTIKILGMFEIVIGEEAHEAGGNSYFEILRHCKNATIRVALTATPFMRDSAEDNMRLMAAFGPILVRVPEELLINRGILAKPYFKFVDVEPHPKLRKTSPWERARKLGYVENMNMHKAIVRDALMAKSLGLPVLTLIQLKDHGDVLKRAMELVGIRVVYLRGENDQRERKAALKALGSGKIDAIIGTTILDVGVDVPAVGLVQLAAGGKAEVATRQRIGRGLRSKKSGPNVCFVADYSCRTNSYLRDHAKQRRAIITGTPGFADGVVPEGRDFPWGLFRSIAA